MSTNTPIISSHAWSRFDPHISTNPKSLFLSWSTHQSQHHKHRRISYPIGFSRLIIILVAPFVWSHSHCIPTIIHRAVPSPSNPSNPIHIHIHIRHDPIGCMGRLYRRMGEWRCRRFDVPTRRHRPDPATGRAGGRYCCCARLLQRGDNVVARDHRQPGQDFWCLQPLARV